MNINFFSIDIFDDNGIAAGADFLKTWYNWEGYIPQIGDIVKLHWSTPQEDDAGITHEDPYKVVSHVIDGKKPKWIDIYVSKLNLQI